jgi:hypothetical protein
MSKELSDKTAGAVTLIQGDASRYYEKYVAFPSFSSREVVAFGEDPVKVMEEARSKGHKGPVLLYVPNPEESQIYAAA